LSRERFSSISITTVVICGITEGSDGVTGGGVVDMVLLRSVREAILPDRCGADSERRHLPLEGRHDLVGSDTTPTSAETPSRSEPA
jgi:hypothetical protein